MVSYSHHCTVFVWAVTPKLTLLVYGIMRISKILTVCVVIPGKLSPSVTALSFGSASYKPPSLCPQWKPSTLHSVSPVKISFPSHGSGSWTLNHPNEVVFWWFSKIADCTFTKTMLEHLFWDNWNLAVWHLGPSIMLWNITGFANISLVPERLFSLVRLPLLIHWTTSSPKV